MENDGCETSIYYDMYKEDKIGSKIISTLKCDNFDNSKMIEFLKNKIRQSMQTHPHLNCRFVNYSWQKIKDVDLDKMILSPDKTYDQIIETELNVPIPDTLPGWRVFLVKNNCIMFVCEHVYGDGAFISNMIQELFDDKSLNNIPPLRHKTKLSWLSKIILFFKILFLIFKRFNLSKSTVDVNDNKCKQICLGQLSLSELKNIRSRFSCSDGTHISINDILHTILVYSNALYFKKDMISSAAMFNMRSNDNDYASKNKLGFILLTNKVKTDGPPEDVLRDVHEFMQFYKETPITPIISKCMNLLYALNPTRTYNALQGINKSVDFIISNFVLQYKDKSLNDGIKINDISACSASGTAGQSYTIVTYGDTLTINLTYKCRKINDINKFVQCYNDSLLWIKS
tara:strand:- start:5519 stop:6718 length:1200 start_codon:yes stop_codon:yes gene_type:complete